MGTPWITQRGFREPEIDRLAAIIAGTLKACQPFSYDGKGGKADWRAKIDFETLAQAAFVVRRRRTTPRMAAAEKPIASDEGSGAATLVTRKLSSVRT